MRSVRIITAVFICALLTACDDTIVMDLVPDQADFLWLSLNYEENDENHLNSDIAKYDLANQRWVAFYDTPFVHGRTYDIACGAGQVWVYGSFWDSTDQTYGSRLWELNTGFHDIGVGSIRALTFGDYNLWLGRGGVYGDSSFYRTDPDTYMTEEAFTYQNPRGGG